MGTEGKCSHTWATQHRLSRCPLNLPRELDLKRISRHKQQLFISFSLGVVVGVSLGHCFCFMLRSIFRANTPLQGQQVLLIQGREKAMKRPPGQSQ